MDIKTREGVKPPHQRGVLPQGARMLEAKSSALFAAMIFFTCLVFPYRGVISQELAQTEGPLQEGRGAEEELIEPQRGPQPAPQAAPKTRERRQKRFLFKPLPAGIFYLKNPETFFFRPADVEYLYAGTSYKAATPAQREELNEAMDQLYLALRKGNYTAAESLLLQDVEKHINTLNLILLYLYLEETPNALKLFHAWEASVGQETMVKAVRFFEARQWLYVQSRLAPSWSKGYLRFFASYLAHRESGDVASVRSNFIEWEGVIDEMKSRSPKVPMRKYYIEARLDWMVETQDYKSLLKWDEAVRANLTPSQALQIQQAGNLNAKSLVPLHYETAFAKRPNLSRDFYTRYFFLLMEAGEYELMRRLIEESRLNYSHTQGEMEAALKERESTAKPTKAVIIHPAKPENVIAP